MKKEVLRTNSRIIETLAGLKKANSKGLANFVSARPPAGVSLRRSINFFNMEMRLYISWCITHPRNSRSFREIKCEKCNAYENLEFHHKKYAPEEKVFIKDIRISCNKCHRNSKVTTVECRRSKLRTVFENGKRYCETSHYKFEY
jgi:hypothetical protein